MTYHYYLFDSTTSNTYIDTTEHLLYVNVEPEELPPDNLFYYVLAEDKSYKVSISSDTIGYVDYVCPTCQGEIGPDSYSSNQINNAESPMQYSISNYPNPFNPTTKIYYTIPKEGNVKITIYNSIGQKVTELVNEFKEIGIYLTEFNGSNIASGIYYYKIEAGNFIQTKKMLLIK